MSNGNYAPQRLWKSCQRYSGTKTSRTDINLSVYSILTIIAVVQFTFNTNQLAISEGGDLPNEVSILKIGQNEMTISFQVRVIPGTASDPSGIIIMILTMSKMNLMWTKSILFKYWTRCIIIFHADYTANSGYLYIFTNSTQQLPIRTQLVGDRAGEPIENFMICLPDSIMGARVIEPTCVTITIVDDDCKYASNHYYTS